MSKKELDNKHQFALFVSDLSELIANSSSGQLVHLADTSLYHRIYSVLRLKPGEELLFFDQKVHIRCLLQSSERKHEITCELLEKIANTNLTPSITFLLPLLKRDDLEQALYSFVELGATTIQLVMTEKVHRSWGGKKEFERLHRIMISAAEQSKNFVVPDLHEPKPLEVVCNELGSSIQKIFFDPHGQPLGQVIKSVSEHKNDQLVLLIGPEGDLTPREKEFIRSMSFQFCALTPTVLRSFQAAALGLGIFRSLV